MKKLCVNLVIYKAHTRMHSQQNIKKGVSVFTELSRLNNVTSHVALRYIMQYKKTLLDHLHNSSLHKCS